MVIVDELKPTFPARDVMYPTSGPARYVRSRARPDGRELSVPLGDLHLCQPPPLSTLHLPPTTSSATETDDDQEAQGRMKESVPLALCPGPAPTSLPATSAVLGPCSPAAAIHLALGYLDLASLPPFSVRSLNIHS